MEKQQRQLASVYVGAVGSATEIGVAVDSVRNLKLRTGDYMAPIIRGTKGYEARQAHVRRFMESGHGALVLLDADMHFEADTVERLRLHGEPFVSGYYMRRQFQPIAPVWFEPSDEWPMMPWLTEPERGKLHPLGASGWGCVLIHREVFEATAKILKGEWFVAEDDMDVWPYDLTKVMTAIRTLKTKYGEDDAACREAVQVLGEEIRPLRGDFDGDIVGSDIRFPWYAKAAGYQLMGDPDVRPGHYLDYPLSPDDYTANGQRQTTVLTETAKHVQTLREQYRNRLAELCTS